MWGNKTFQNAQLKAINTNSQLVGSTVPTGRLERQVQEVTGYLRNSGELEVWPDLAVESDGWRHHGCLLHKWKAITAEARPRLYISLML